MSEMHTSRPSNYARARYDENEPLGACLRANGNLPLAFDISGTGYSTASSDHSTLDHFRRVSRWLDIIAASTQAGHQPRGSDSGK